MATHSRKRCALRDFLGFEWPDDDSDTTTSRTNPGELYEIFALPGVLYENLALIIGHRMEYTLACIWCYYYDDGLEYNIQDSSMTHRLNLIAGGTC